MKEKRHFALRDKDGNETSIFTGRSPRQAALKAATRGHTEIDLREKGTLKVHVFVGQRVQIKRPKKGPEWMPKRIWKSSVRKLGVRSLEKI